MGANQNWTQNWDYDRYGNRPLFTQNIGGNTSAWNPTVVATSNRFGENQGFTYDKNGNVVNDIDPLTSHNRLFTFNGDNKQIEVKDTSTNTTKGKYFYDGEGKRVKKVNPETGETTIFVYSSGKLVAEYSTATPPANPSIYYTTTDHLGSPRVITDAIGQVKSRRDFLPFGEEVTPNVGNRSASPGYSATDNIRQKFTGYEKDTETSLDFAEARMYENRFGRFTAVDPLLASGKSANPQTFNRFIYVANNPVMVADPSGLDPWWQGNCANGRCEYRESKTKPTEGTWDLVDFKGSWYTTISNWGTPGSGVTAYLYAGGGQDTGHRWFQSILSNCAPAYQCTGLNPRFNAEAAGQGWMGMGGAGYNGFAGLVNTTNFLANNSSGPLVFQYLNGTPGRTAFGYLPMYEPRTGGERMGYVLGSVALATAGAANAVREGAAFSFGNRAANSGILNRGGSYAELFAAKESNQVPHHMPQNAFLQSIGIPRGQGPSLGITRSHHGMTRTFAGRGKSAMINDLGLNPRERLFNDVIDIRQNFGRQYNRGMLELIDYSKTLPWFQK